MPETPRVGCEIPVRAREASGVAREQKDDGGVRTDPERQKGLGQGREAGHPRITQQVRELPGNDSPTAMK